MEFWYQGYIGVSCLAISSQTLDHNAGLEYSTGERVLDGQNAVPNSRLVISLVRWRHMPTVSDEDGSKMGAWAVETVETDNSWLSMNSLMPGQVWVHGLNQVLEEGDRDAEVSDNEDSLVLYTRLCVQSFVVHSIVLVNT